MTAGLTGTCAFALTIGAWSHIRNGYGLIITSQPYALAVENCCCFVPGTDARHPRACGGSRICCTPRRARGSWSSPCAGRSAAPSPAGRPIASTASACGSRPPRVPRRRHLAGTSALPAGAVGRRNGSQPGRVPSRRLRPRCMRKIFRRTRPMCNCGPKRASVPPGLRRSGRRTRPTPPVPPRGRCFATSTLAAPGSTVFGGAMRARYRFAYPGAQVAVDARNGASLDGRVLERLHPTRSPEPRGRRALRADIHLAR